MGFKVWRSVPSGSKRFLVSAVNRIWVLKSGGQFPAGARDFLFSKMSRPALGPTQTLFSGCWGLLPMVKYLMHEAEPPSPCSTKVKNEWSYTSPSLICLPGVHTVSAAFSFIISVLALQCAHLLSHVDSTLQCAHLLSHVDSTLQCAHLLSHVDSTLQCAHLLSHVDSTLQCAHLLSHVDSTLQCAHLLDRESVG
jgi:hypothetical protein